MANKKEPAVAKCFVLKKMSHRLDLRDLAHWAVVGEQEKTEKKKNERGSFIHLAACQLSFCPLSYVVIVLPTLRNQTSS